MKARAKRIFPFLWMVIILSVFILGPILTDLPLNAYFTNHVTWLYLLNGLFIPVHNLPGVFENCITMSTVNGALWTLSVEAICYAALFILYKLKMINKEKIFLSIPLFLVFFIMLIGVKNILHMDIFENGNVYYIYSGKSFIRYRRSRQIWGDTIYCDGNLYCGKETI